MGEPGTPGVAGPIGPTGPVGATGPTGPAGNPDFTSFGSCPGLDKVTGIDPSTGAVLCGADRDSVYAEGDGLALADGTFSVLFGGDGSAASAARSDHGHSDLATAASLTALEAEVASLRQQLEEDAFCPRLVSWTNVRRDYAWDGVFPRTRCDFGMDVMVKVGDFWIDRYESVLVDRTAWANGQCDTSIGTIYANQPTPVDDYPGVFPDNGNWAPCGGCPLFPSVYACSVEGVLPSRRMTWFQAAQACATVGKRLCTSAEWQTAAAFTPDPGDSDGTGGACLTNAVEPRVTGLGCQSIWNARDMIGNVAEWVADWYADPGWTGLPSFWPDVFPAEYYLDAYWSGASGGPSDVLVEGFGRPIPAATLRGGSYLNTTSAGVFAIDVSHGPPDSSAHIGMRCCASR